MCFCGEIMTFSDFFMSCFPEYTMKGLAQWPQNNRYWSIIDRRDEVINRSHLLGAIHKPSWGLSRVSCTSFTAIQSFKPLANDWQTYYVESAQVDGRHYLFKWPQKNDRLQIAQISSESKTLWPPPFSFPIVFHTVAAIGRDGPKQMAWSETSQWELRIQWTMALNHELVFISQLWRTWAVKMEIKQLYTS